MFAVFLSTKAHADLRAISPFVILYTTNNWQTTQTFKSSTTFVSGTMGINGVTYVWPNSQVSGCLNNDGSGNLSWAPCSGGSASVDWEIDANFVGPNLAGANPLKFKSLEVEGNLNILNAYGTVDQ